MTSMIRILIRSALVVLLAVASAPAQDLYAVDADENLYRVDPATGEAVLRGNFGLDFMFPFGLADRDGALYTIDRIRNLLVRIDPSDGSILAELDVGLSPTVVGGEGALTFGPDGFGLVATSIDDIDGFMYQIDLDSMETLELYANYGLDGLDYSPGEMLLYGFRQNSSDLVALHPVTGSVIFFAQLPIPPQVTAGLSVHPNGTIWIATGEGHLFMFDPIGAGGGFVGQMGVTDICGLSWLEDGVEPLEDPVVELSLDSDCGATLVWARDRRLEFLVTATDPNLSEEVTLEAFTKGGGPLPDGASFVNITAGFHNPLTYRFVWVPGEDHDGLTELVFRATDPGGQTDECELTVDVKFDRDGDGISDLHELDGYTGPNGIFVNLPGLGAQVGRKDLFVYLDYMLNAEFDHRPSDVAIQKVVDAFANAPVGNFEGPDGITLHLWVSPDPMLHRPPPAGGPVSTFVASLGALDTTGQYLWAKPGGFADATVIFFDDIKNGKPDEDGAGPAVAIPTHFAPELALSHRYGLFCHNIDGKTDSGIARGMPTSDFIVSLGSFVVSSGAPPHRPTDSDQAGTLMHELGHTIGLRHGGGDQTNFKANYLSIMNYAYQRTGMTVNGTAGKFDYSRFALPVLNEASLSETSGIDNWPAAVAGFQTSWRILLVDKVTGVPIPDPSTGELQFETLWSGPYVATGPFPIDWNDRSGSAETLVNFSINSNLTFESMSGFDDWGNIDFKGGTVGSGVGVPLPPTSPRIELTLEVAKTIPPSPATGLAGRSARGMVRLSWIPAAPRGEVTYFLYRGPAGGVLALHATTQSTLYADRGLARGDSYDYAVAVVNSLQAKSRLSKILSVTVR